VKQLAWLKQDTLNTSFDHSLQKLDNKLCSIKRLFFQDRHTNPSEIDVKRSQNETIMPICAAKEDAWYYAIHNETIKAIEEYLRY